jgi:hypothetical protein
MDALLVALAGAGVGAVLTGAISYFVGKKHGRENLRYQQRVETVKELFTRIREVQWELVNASAPADIEFEGNPSREERADTMGEELDELDAYRRDNEVWLSEEANNKVDELIDMFYEALDELRVRLEECEDEDEAARLIYEDRVEKTGNQMFDAYDELVKSL